MKGADEPRLSAVDGFARDFADAQASENAGEVMLVCKG